MPTEAQVNANRANAQKSTGPRTEEGKSRSSRNATTHGLYSNSTHLPGEPDGLFESILDRYISELQPVGCLEGDAIYRMAVGMLRIMRSRRFEEGFLEALMRVNESAMRTAPGEDTDQLAWAVNIDCLMHKNLDHLNRYTRPAQRDYDNCRDTLLKMQAERKKAEAAQRATVPPPRKPVSMAENVETNPQWPMNPQEPTTYDPPTAETPRTEPPGKVPAAK